MGTDSGADAQGPAPPRTAPAPLPPPPSPDFARLFREHGPVLWRAIFAYTGGNAQVADDAVAEAFTRAIEHASTIREPLPWIYRTAFRFASAEARLVTSPRVAQEPARPGLDQGSMTELIGALRQLSPSQRAEVVLHYEADLPVKEVAGRMGSSVAAIKVHLFRGRRKLRALLGSEEVHDD